MRSPKRRRPRKSDRLDATQIDLTQLSIKVSYIISTEHKDHKTSAGPGNLRSDASACPRQLRRDQVEKWLKKAVAAGDVSATLDGEYPRYVWTRVEGKVYEARLSNSGLGQYKGYPLKDSEAPGWLK